MSEKMFWSEYVFNNQADLTSDATDQTINSLQNTRMANHLLYNNYSDQNLDILSASYIDFESKNLAMITGNPCGPGIGGHVIERNNDLTMSGVVKERSFGKLELFPRPYVTVPYLGRGSCDVDVESEMMQGKTDYVGKKSANTVMSKSFTEYALMPALESEPNENVIESFSLGGASSRSSTA